MSVLKLTLRHCLCDALTQILEYHAHTELVYTFIIIIEKVIQKLSFPDFSAVLDFPTVAVLGYFGVFWAILDYFRLFSIILGSFGPFWTVLSYFGLCWAI